MIMIQNDITYEFHYVNHNYITMHIPYLANSNKTPLFQTHYVVTTIRSQPNYNLRRKRVSASSTDKHSEGFIRASELLRIHEATQVEQEG